MLKLSYGFYDKFIQCYDEDSLINTNKAEFIHYHCNKTKELLGCTAELGVYLGHTSKFIHLINLEKSHYCYDTFSGVAKAEPEKDGFFNGDFAAPFEIAKKRLEQFDNVYFRIGILPETFKEHDLKFSFVHSDMDTYFGVQETYKYFAPRMVKGGKILFDDYNGPRCKAIRQSIQELMKNNHEFNFDCSSTQICFTKV